MTTKVLDWLNNNRHIAYPFVNDAGLVVSGSRIPDCILLDCLVVDTRFDVPPSDMVFTGFEVTDKYTEVTFTYSDKTYTHRIPDSDSDSTISKYLGRVDDHVNGGMLEITLTLSSHRYIIDNVGKGVWKFFGQILPSKIIRVPASGVNGISTKGSYKVEGFELPGIARGDVHLVDGFRTQPVVHDGKVLVKVGTGFGYDPCHYKGRYDVKRTSCDELLLFFCGQNAITSGDISLEGGPGINVEQGRTYTAKEDILDSHGNIGIRKGEEIPCVEIIATSSLKRLWKPPIVAEE